VDASVGELSFDARALSSGIVIVVLDYESPGHASMRKVLKAAILH